MKRLILIILLLAATLTAQRINLQPSRTTFPSDSLNIYTIVGDGGDVYLEQVPFASLKTFLADSGLIAKTIIDTMSLTGAGNKYYVDHSIEINTQDDQSMNNWGLVSQNITIPNTMSYSPANVSIMDNIVRNYSNDEPLNYLQPFLMSSLNCGTLDYGKNVSSFVENADTVNGFWYNYYSFFNNNSSIYGTPYIPTVASARLKIQNTNTLHGDASTINNAHIVSAKIENSANAGKPAVINNVKGFGVSLINSANGELGDVTVYDVPEISNSGNLTGDFKGVHIASQPEFDGTNYGIHDESDSSKFKIVIAESTSVTGGISFKGVMHSNGNWINKDQGQYGLQFLDNYRFRMGNSAASDKSYLGGHIAYQTDENLRTALRVYGKHDPSATYYGSAQAMQVLGHLYPSSYVGTYNALSGTAYIFDGTGDVGNFNALNFETWFYDDNHDVAYLSGISSSLNSPMSGINITNFYGVNNKVSFRNSTNTSTNAPVIENYFGFRDSPNVDYHGEITNRYAISVGGIESLFGSAFANTNNYGIHVSDQTNPYTSNDNYAIYAQGPKSYIENVTTNSTTPTGTADATGTTGQITFDDNYIYIKTSAGWKRAALSTF